MTVAVQYPPVHVAVIMDGNGRWAEKRGLPRVAGHEAGGKNVRSVVRIFSGYGVRYLTIYMFSTENWNRPEAEIAGLMRVLGRTIDQEIQASRQESTRLVHLGRLDRLPQELKHKVQAAAEITKDNTGITLCLALDYGGRDEILRAVRLITRAGSRSGDMDDSVFAQHLYTAGIPDPDLVIRPGGEVRLSNFLVWQLAHSELHFTPTLWPDFGRKDIEEAFSQYRCRRLRLGRTRRH